MANVFFKRGHQAALDLLKQNVENSVEGAAFQEGSFYLTDDTNRLYFAQASNKLVELNQFIHFVDVQRNPTSGQTALPTAADATLKEGDIYYILDENILCIYTNNNWKQINPDTYLVSSNAAMTVETDNGAAYVGVNLRDSKNDQVSGGFTITGGSNVQVSSSGNTITIDSTDTNTDTTYDLETANSQTEGIITLKGSNNSTDTITIKGGTNISLRTNGPDHATEPNTITISSSSAVTGITDEFTENGVYTITLEGLNASTTGKTPTINYGHTSDGNGGYVNSATPAVFANGTASLDVYTATEVDNLIANRLSSIDAMHYNGLINSALEASTYLLSNPTDGLGTVYKINADFEMPGTISGIGNQKVKKGDLVIAGKGANGLGTDNNVVWEIVPSGDDQLLTVTGNASENAVTFGDSLENHADLGMIALSGGRKTNSANNAAIEVSTNVVNQSYTTFSIVHGDPGTGTAVSIPAATGDAVQTTGTALSIPVITALSKDDQGHVTSVSAQTYQLTDTHAVLQPITKGVDAVNNVGTAAFTFQLDTAASQSSQTATISIKSNNLKITSETVNRGTASEDTYIVVDLEWGTF